MYTQQQRYSPGIPISSQHLHPTNDSLLPTTDGSGLLPSTGFSNDYLSSPHSTMDPGRLQESPNPAASTDVGNFSDFFNFEPGSDLAQWHNFPSTVSDVGGRGVCVMCEGGVCCDVRGRCVCDVRGWHHFLFVRTCVNTYVCTYVCKNIVVLQFIPFYTQCHMLSKYPCQQTPLVSTYSTYPLQPVTDSKHT